MHMTMNELVGFFNSMIHQNKSSKNRSINIKNKSLIQNKPHGIEDYDNSRMPKAKPLRTYGSKNCKKTYLKIGCRVPTLLLNWMEIKSNKTATHGKYIKK